LVSKPDGASKEVIAAVIVIVRELTLNMTDFLKRTPLCIYQTKKDRVHALFMDKMNCFRKQDEYNYRLLESLCPDYLRLIIKKKEYI